MDSLKSDAIRKIFGAATPQRTYEQHFGRVYNDGKPTFEMQETLILKELAKRLDTTLESARRIAQQVNLKTWLREPGYMWRSEDLDTFVEQIIGEMYDNPGAFSWFATGGVAGEVETEKGPFNFTWVSNIARQIFNGLFQGKPPAEANAAFETFLSKDLREAWKIEDNKGLDYPAETMEWLPNALYKLAGQYGASVGSNI